MSKIWTGISAGLLAGAAGATAKNAVSYLDQAAQGDTPDTSPASGAVTDTAGSVTPAAVDRTRAAALGPLGGLAIGVGVGAVAGAVRGTNATPPPVLAAVVTGLAAMAVGEGAAIGTGSDRHGRTTVGLLRDAVSHLAFGAVTSYALHRMLDPHTSSVARFNPLSS